MNNGRPLTLRKKVQLLLALTILAWATQTLFAQWSHGAEAAPAFVPREAGVRAGGGTLELRAEARIYGGDVKLKQVCRWSDVDATMFAPVADLVIAKLDTRRPFKVLEVRDVLQMLEEAGINVALVRFAGPVECTVSRADAELKEGEALEQWVKAQEQRVAPPAVVQASLKEPADAAPNAAEPAAARTAASSDAPRGARTLRDVLLADLAVRLSVPTEQLVVSFEPQAEAVINLPESNFKFNVQPRRARDLGEVAWDVTITGPSSGSRRAEIRGTARAWQNQVVVARPLSRRQVIQVSDLARRRTMVTQLPDASLLKAEQVVGQMAARDLKPGTVMTAPLVEAVPLAKPGQFVTVTLARGNVRIKSVAKAMEGGSYGQTIRVKNEATKEIYQVLLTGPQEASMAPVDGAPEEEKGVASALD